MILYFRNGLGKLRKIGKINGRMKPENITAEIDRQIKAFCDDRHYKIPYVRMFNEEVNGKIRTCFDVGSHTEFFYTYPPSFDLYLRG